MSVQLNLLPKVKKDFLKAQRTKRLFIFGSIVISGAFIGLVVLLLLYVGTQRVLILRAEDSINKNIQTIQSEEDLDKILTVQNQLNALPELHSSKPAVKRTFQYLNRITPSTVELHDVTVNFEEQTITIQGGGEDLQAVNTFADTIKFSRYLATDSQDDSNNRNIDIDKLPLAFSNVVFTDLSKSSDTSGSDSDATATFSLSFSYAEELFNNKYVLFAGPDSSGANLRFVVPRQDTSPSAVGRPGGLFGDEFVEEEAEDQR